MTTISYPLRIPEEIMALSKLRADQEHLDQATALRQFLYLGAEKYLLELVSTGRISIGKAAELLRTSIYNMHDAAKKHGISIGATAEQAKKSRETAKKVFE